jgi:hypothetical protein
MVEQFSGICESKIASYQYRRFLRSHRIIVSQSKSHLGQKKGQHQLDPVGPIGSQLKLMEMLEDDSTKPEQLLSSATNLVLHYAMKPKSVYGLHTYDCHATNLFGQNKPLAGLDFIDVLIRVLGRDWNRTYTDATDYSYGIRQRRTHSDMLRRRLSTPVVNSPVLQARLRMAALSSVVLRQ